MQGVQGQSFAQEELDLQSIQILQYLFSRELTGAGEGVNPGRMAKEIYGQQATKKLINPTLYKLKNKNYVVKTSREDGSKPRWRIATTGAQHLIDIGFDPRVNPVPVQQVQPPAPQPTLAQYMSQMTITPSTTQPVAPTQVVTQPIVQAAIQPVVQTPTQATVQDVAPVANMPSIQLAPATTQSSLITPNQISDAWAAGGGSTQQTEPTVPDISALLSTQNPN